jgi:hypothetical protein
MFKEEDCSTGKRSKPAAIPVFHTGLFPVLALK